MKRVPAILAACALCLAAAQSAAAEARVDLGGILVKEIDGIPGDSKHRNLDGFLDELPVLPLPEIAFGYRWEAGPLKLGAGVRAFSLMAETMAWPEARAELELGKASIEARLGCGAFAMVGLSNGSAFGAVLVPDLSAWYRLRGPYRIGVGAAGLYVPDAFGKPMTLLVYLGGRATIGF